MPHQNMLAKTSGIVALCSIANFINAADRVIMPIAIVPMTDEFKWSLHWQGWILSAFAFGYFTSQVTMTRKTGSINFVHVLLAGCPEINCFHFKVVSVM
jgi:predicted MFS family arabinose efflux permease